MNKRLAWLAFFIMVCFTMLLSGCIQEQKKPQEIEKSTVSIGVLIALTGKSANYGVEMKNGFELAAEKINSGDSRFKIRLVFEDTESSPEKAATSVQKLLEVNGLSVFCGSTSSSESLAIAPLTERKKALFFIPLSSAKEISNAGDFVFRLRENAELHGIKAARLALDLNLGSTAVLSAQSPNSLSYKNGFLQEFLKRDGKTAIIIDYNPAGTDFKSEIAKLKETNPGFIFLASGTEKDGAIIVRQLRESGVKAQIIGTMSLETSSFLESAGNAAEGLLITTSAFDPDANASAEFSKAYAESFGKNPDFLSAYSFDSLMILHKAIEDCNGTDTACLKNHLYALKDFEGITGTTSFDKNGDALKPIAIKQAKGGKFEVLEN